jgi:hypothetical protein
LKPINVGDAGEIAAAEICSDLLYCDLIEKIIDETIWMQSDIRVPIEEQIREIAWPVALWDR